MRIFLFMFFILLPHTAYGEYIKPHCSDSNCDFAINIVMLPALDSEAPTRCGGALVSMQWSITVAHCIQNLFRIRTERAASARRRRICVRAGFDEELNVFDHRSVKRYIKNTIDNALEDVRHSIALVETEIPFIPKPNIRPIKIPKPGTKVKICNKPNTVSVITHVKKSTEIKISRPVKINTNKKCPCPPDNKNKTPAPKPKPEPEPTPAPTPAPTTAPTTNKSHTEPSLICGETEVPGQSRMLPIIEAEEESYEELKKDVLKMSSCVGAIGSCLVCNDVLVGLQNRCRRGGARGGTAEVVFTGIESYLDFIAATVKDDLPKPPKNKTDKPPTSGADILKRDVWIANLVAGIGTFYFIYF